MQKRLKITPSKSSEVKAPVMLFSRLRTSRPKQSQRLTAWTKPRTAHPLSLVKSKVYSSVAQSSDLLKVPLMQLHNMTH
jgi:hypothetical protein